MKNTDFLTKTHFTHRGLHDNKSIPENSLIAYEEAIKHGYGIEFDVYLTLDGSLIIHHDNSILRTTGIDMKAWKIDSSHLEKYKLYGTNHSIPLLSDMLDLVAGQVPLILEIKTTNRVKSTCQAIYDMIKNYKGNICVESFDPRIVNWWTHNHPEFVIGQLYGDNLFVNAYLKLCRQYRKCDFLALSVKQLQKKYYEKVAKRKGNRLIINWTVKTPDNLRNAVAFADNFIFEYNGKNNEYITLDDINNSPL